MPTLADRIAQAARELALVTETPRLDAEILLAHALGLTRSGLLTRLQDNLEPEGYGPLIQRRLTAEPIAHILGEWEFFSLAFEVLPPVLVPRPETEHLVEVVLECIGEGPARVLEIGTGSGCVAVALAYNAPKCRVTATDIVAENLVLAGRNAARHGVESRIEFRHGDLFDALKPDDGPFDFICSNPPYVEEGAWPELPAAVRDHEDRRALLAGVDGLAIIRRLISGSGERLRAGGRLAFEMGMGQYERVTTLLDEQHYDEIGHRKDLAGIERIAFGKISSDASA